MWQDAGKIGTASDAAKSFDLLKILARGHPRAAQVVKTYDTCETHMIIRVLAVIETWGDAVRCESLGACHGQSTIIGWVLRVGITRNSVCLAAYHWQMDFSAYWMWLAVLRQCFSSGTAANGHTQYKPRPSQNWPKINTYDHVHQIFITSCTWFRHGVLCDRGFTSGNALVLNSYHPGQNGPYFADKNIFKCISMNKKFCISVQISLKFVPKGLVNNKAAWTNFNVIIF